MLGPAESNAMEALDCFKSNYNNVVYIAYVELIYFQGLKSQLLYQHNLVELK